MACRGLWFKVQVVVLAHYHLPLTSPDHRPQTTLDLTHAPTLRRSDITFVAGGLSLFRRRTAEGRTRWRYCPRLASHSGRKSSFRSLSRRVRVHVHCPHPLRRLRLDEKWPHCVSSQPIWTALNRSTPYTIHHTLCFKGMPRGGTFDE